MPFELTWRSLGDLAPLQTNVTFITRIDNRVVLKYVPPVPQKNYYESAFLALYQQLNCTIYVAGCYYGDCYVPDDTRYNKKIGCDKTSVQPLDFYCEDCEIIVSVVNNNFDYK